MNTANPYVGPRPFALGERLYGRDEDLAQLRLRLLSDRIVLLYAPSGAGKTSLVTAGLVPALTHLGFEVLGPTRLGTPLGPDAADLGNGHISNFERSLAAGVDQRCGANLDELYNETGEVEGESCLIVDAFEELFTINPGASPDKEAFIARLGKVLEERSRWALLVIREDFLARLDPYLELLPTALASRMRLDLLGPDAAMQAIRDPASVAGRTFTEAAATALVDDLRRLKVNRPGGGVEEELGPFVEPVQLQVVCHQLWNRIPLGRDTIDVGDLTAGGDVDEALRTYYATQVAADNGANQSE